VSGSIKFASIFICSFLFLAGCGASPDMVETSESAIESSEDVETEAEVTDGLRDAEQVETYPCDTSEQDLLTTVADKSWNSFIVDCPVDTQTSAPALPKMLLSSNLEPCQLVEVNDDRKLYDTGPIPVLTVGYPRQERRLPNANYKVIVIPVDWPDLKDAIAPEDFLVDEAKMYSDWYLTYSRGKVRLDVEVYPEWIELPVESDMFSQSEFEQNANQWGESNVAKLNYWWTTALEAADPFVDFTDVDMVMFVAPRHQEVFAEFNLWPDGTKTFQTDEGPIKRGFTSGEFHFRAENSLWYFWVHETLHYFSIPDLYWVDLNSFRAQPQTLPAPNYGYDVMTFNQMSRLSSWFMWLLEWTEDYEMACLTEDTFSEGSIEIASESINDERTKGVMLKLSDHELLMIESHRESKFDFPDVRSLNGVLVQYLNTEIPHGQGAMTLIAPKGRTLLEIHQQGGNRTTVIDGVLYEGNSIDIAGYRITVSESLVDSDIVSFSRVDADSLTDEPNYVCISRENRERTGIDGPLGCPLNF